jgi:hypothetical protein
MDCIRRTQEPQSVPALQPLAIWRGVLAPEAISARTRCSVTAWHTHTYMTVLSDGARLS